MNRKMGKGVRTHVPGTQVDGPTGTPTLRINYAGQENLRFAVLLSLKLAQVRIENPTDEGLKNCSNIILCSQGCSCTSGSRMI